MRTLTLKLLPLEVPLQTISDPTSRIITPQVVDAYIAAAGDFLDAVSVKFLSYGDSGPFFMGSRCQSCHTVS